MMRHNGDTENQLRLIEGGRQGPKRTASLPQPPAPRFSGPELASELAQHFAFGLCLDMPLDRLMDPHAELPHTRSDMQGLLCELRNLRWFDALQPSQTLGVANSSPTSERDADHRRAVSWNGDGQLTLSGLLRGPVARGAGVSPLLMRDAERLPRGGAGEAPSSQSPMSAWLDWTGRHVGCGPDSPTFAASPKPMVRLRDLTSKVASAPASRPFYTTALTQLANGTRFDHGLTDGLGNTGFWHDSRLMSLLAKAEAFATDVALRRAGRLDRLTRPGVMAARITVLMAKSDHAPIEAPIDEAANELEHACSTLLDWVSAANNDNRGPQRFERSLFLPLLHASCCMHPADLAPHMLVAGAMGTLIKAVFASPPTGPLRLAGEHETDLPRAIDTLAANFALARTAAATHYPAENHQDLRIGEALALTLLRDAMERDNRSATLTFTDFDGRRVDIRAHPRSFGRGHAQLLRDEYAVVWPQDGGQRAAHLTAVS